MSNERATVLQDQIRSCEALLGVFQKERSFLQGRDQVQTPDLLPMLQAKQRLLGTFDTQRDLLRDLGCRDEPTEPERALLRTLASLLEKLLVIERENDLLIRRLLGSDAGASTGRAQPPPSAVSGRPAASARAVRFGRSGRLDSASLGHAAELSAVRKSRSRYV